MSMYEYACHDCGEVIEKKFAWAGVPSKIECLKCGGMAHKIFSAPIVIQSGYKHGDARYGRGKGK